MSEHLVPFGETGWSVWRDAGLRSTGFPIDGLDRFAAPDCAKAADAVLDGEDAGRFDELFADAVAANSATCLELAADPLLREAITWQSPTAMAALDGLLRGSGNGRKRRQRERLVARYWQRYCAKNETIGFFGPSAWVTVDPEAPAITVRVGDRLVRSRAVDFEYWVLATFVRGLAKDPSVRRWLPPALPPHFTLADRQVLRVGLPPLPVSASEAAALRRCDGRVTAATVLAALVADGVVRTEDDGYLLLDRLAERELLTWQGDLPQSRHAEARLRALLAGIGAPDVRARATAAFDRLADARAEIAAAAGDPDRLAAGFEALAEEFTAGTGEPPYHRAGQAYAGRGLCVEEATRDVDVVFGGPLLATIAKPMGLVLQAARWLTTELTRAYGSAFRELYDGLVADGEDVRLGDLWYFAQGSLFGTGERPVDAVAREFTRRWSTLFGLDSAVPGKALHFGSDELAEAASAVFPAARPGWSAGRLHSPDLLICADSVAAIERGDYLVVLGEIHAAWAGFDIAGMTRWHPDHDALVRALAADLGEHRVRLLFPDDWPGYTGRLAHTLDGPTDHQLGFTAAPGADPDRLLPITSMTVAPGPDGELLARAPDGRRWPLPEVFSGLLSMYAADAFKVTDTAAHTPRITVDRLVVAREKWRTDIAATGLTEVIGERARYLAVRRWQRDMGLPDRVFVKLDAETKPFYADLTSPVHTGLLCVMLRSAKTSGGKGVVTITELLPDTGQHWLTDATGRRYSSELRLQVVDPEAVR